MFVHLWDFGATFFILQSPALCACADKRLQLVRGFRACNRIKTDIFAYSHCQSSVFLDTCICICLSKIAGTKKKKKKKERK